jgi:S1-C subfamily serine protease
MPLDQILLRDYIYSVDCSKEKFMSQLILIVVLAFNLTSQVFAQQSPPPNAKDLSMLMENERNSINVFQDTANAIVNVSNIVKAKGVFDLDATEVQSGIGSGFVWDKAGHIITNFHVVDGGTSYVITFMKDKKQYKAKLIGADPKKDIAVLQLLEQPKSLTTITLGESKNLLVGQKALAIGNPLGFDHTLTTGTISALDRKIPGYGGVSIDGMIQTDASINPGNSGGALLNSQGKLIGINTVIFNAGGSSASAGLGFAIPVDTVSAIVPQLIQHGKVIRPGLGIGILADYEAARFGIRDGVMIKFVDPKGPAAKAGLMGFSRDRRGQYYVGDIITAIHGLEVKSYDDLFSAIDKFKIGDKVKVKYIRNNKESLVDVILVEL